MSETLESLRRKMDRAGDLGSVVRTMKVFAAASIGQYEKAVRSLAEYYRTVELGLAACFREPPSRVREERGELSDRGASAIVFGSDQGLVGQFNEVLADQVAGALGEAEGGAVIWAVGERMGARLELIGLPPRATFPAPNSVAAITPLIGGLLGEMEARCGVERQAPVYLFHNRPRQGALHETSGRRLLPLDEQWWRELRKAGWPTENLPEVLNGGGETVSAVIREYLFVSLFKTCAESLAAEHGSRLAAMQRAEKNIGELLEELHRGFHRLRQSTIDEELFDLIAGFEALTGEGGR